MPPVSLPFNELRAGLVLLLEALDWGSPPEFSTWDFAVEIHTLRQAGLSDTHLRWLISGAYLEHAFEFTLPGDENRSFRTLKTLSFRKQSCFLLTPAGADFARPLCEQEAEGAPATDSSATPERSAVNSGLAVKPRWDPELRQLTVGDEVVKRFQRPAQVQEMILAAFEEEHWPSRIDDPLPRVTGLDSKQRVRGAIESLNRHHIAPRIHFFGNGTGESVCWTLVPS